jgi:hypothetical protein
MKAHNHGHKTNVQPESYSQHFIFFVTYKWAPQAMVFAIDMSFQLSVK